MPLEYLFVFLCAGGLAVLVYRYDMYDREPVLLLLFALAAGTAGGWLVGIAEDRLLHSSVANAPSLTAQAAAAATLEELAKLATVLLVALVFRNHFNDPLDGIVYGAFVGLGAALSESFFYLGLASRMSHAWATEAVRLLLHLLLGGLGGFGLGFAACRLRRWPRLLAGSFGAAVALHYLWDRYCGLPARDAPSSAVMRGAAIGLLLAAVFLFGAAVSHGARYSRRLHAPRSRRRLWGWPFTR